MNEIKSKIKEMLQKKSYLVLALDEEDILQEFQLLHDDAIPFFIVTMERVKLSLLQKIEQMSESQPVGSGNG